MQKHLITAAILLLLLGGGGYQFYKYKHPEKFVETTTVTTTSTETNTTNSGSPSVVSATNETIDLPPRPVDGTYKGVVEVGASGFNAFVVNIDKNKNWELIYKEFGKSLAYEGFLTTDDVKKTLKDYISTIAEKGVAGRNTHFVISSGALKNPKTVLIMDAIQKMGYVVNKVSPDQEGKYALIVLPPNYKDNSFVVDLGSGNTKISWYEGSALRTKELPGAKYYQNNLTDESVYGDVLAVAQSIPKDKTQKCFIIGGIPFELAKESRKSDNDRYTILGKPDDYSCGDNIKKKSGLNIYKAIIEGTGTATYIFDWDANFTIGFLASIN